MDMTKITGLWKHTDKNGNAYLSGSLSPVAGLMVMQNTFKEADGKGPDFWLYVKQNQKKSPGPIQKDHFIAQDQANKDEAPF